ncbi:peptidoglycan-binding domain-containing protein [Dermabacteraceae bacterium P13077]
MNTLAARVIDTARKEVGTRETGRNIVKYWSETYPAWQGNPWCGSFVAWAWLQQGIDLRKIMPGARDIYYVPAIESWARKIGAWREDRAQDGDLVVYGFNKREGVHVGLAWPDERSSDYRAIEGNTSPGWFGSQANGGGVYIRYRKRRAIRGWVRMSVVLEQAAANIPAVSDVIAAAATAGAVEKARAAHPAGKAATGLAAPAFPLPSGFYYGPRRGPAQSVSGHVRNTRVPGDVVISRWNAWYSKGLKLWQERMKARGWSITPDGLYGPETERVVRQFQRNKHLVVDGKIGPATWAAVWTEPVK